MAFDPDKYLASKTNKAPPSFDPDAYLASKEQDQGDWEASYGSSSQREAKKRLQERASTPLEPTELKRFSSLAQKEIPQSVNNLGDAVYSAANFGGVLPKGVALGETITGTKPLPEGNFLDNLKANLAIEKEVANQRRERSPVASKVGDIGGDIAAYATGTKLLKSAPLIGEVVGGSKIPELLKLLGRGGFTQSTIGQLRGKDTSTIPLDFALGAGGELIGAGVNKIGDLLKSTAPKLMNSVLKTPLKDLKQGKDIGKELVERGMFGTEKGLLNKAEEGLTSNEGTLQKLLTGSNKNIDKNVVVKELKGLKNFYEQVPGRTAEVEAINSKIADFNKMGDITPSKANEIKRAIYDLRQKSYGKDIVPIQADTEKTMARGLKKAVEGVVPESKNLNKELQFYGQLRKLISDNMAKGEKGGIPLSVKDLLMGGGVGYVNPAVGGGLTLGKALLNTTPGGTTAAIGMKKIGELLKRLKLQKVAAPALSATFNQ